MLDINFIRDNQELVKENIKNRRVTVDLDALLEADTRRRQLLPAIEELRAARKKASKHKPSDTQIAEMKKVGEKIKKLEEQFAPVEQEFKDLLSQIPNLIHPDVPIGSEDDYRVLEEKGSGLSFDFTPQDHESLLTALDLLDFERGAKVAGAKFYFPKGDLVRLNQALLQYAIDKVASKGFTLLETPDMVRQEILDASGFNPRGGESQVYGIKDHDLHLIGTAEIPLLGYHANEILDFKSGPKKYAGLSHCYRTEAGAYGKTQKGLYRGHQFTKLEMFIFCAPEESEVMHQELLQLEKNICDDLGLQYRVIDTASGDLGAPAYRKFDIEARMVMKGGTESGYDFGEITSASNCTDYQARRLNIRHVNKALEKEFVHTLNGTAVALSRFPVAIVEQYQNADGSITVPKVLRPYMGKKKMIK